MEKNNIIVMFEDVDKQLNMSLYDFVDTQYRYAENIVVCNVTEEEYEAMLKQIKSGFLNERLPRATAEDLGYYKYRYLMTYDFIENALSVANYEDFDQKGKYTIDSEGLHYDKDGIQFPKDRRLCRYCKIKVYTTETYESVIEHYKKVYGCSFENTDSQESQQIAAKYPELAEACSKNPKKVLQVREEPKLYKPPQGYAKDGFVEKFCKD